MVSCGARLSPFDIKANERIPAEHPQLKALLTHASQSPDLPTLKERMSTLNNDFTQHYSTAVQNTVDMSGKAEPPAAPSQQAQTKTTSQTKGQTTTAPAAPATKPPAQGENVAAIEAKVKAGEAVNLSDLTDAMKKDKQAAQSSQSKQTGQNKGQSSQPTQAGQPKQSTQPGKSTNTGKTGKTGQNRTYSNSKGKSATKPQEQLSIKEQLAAGKKQLSEKKPTLTRAAVKNKSTGLGD